MSILTTSETGDSGTGKPQGPGLPISGGVLAVVLAGAFLLLRQEPFHPSRPNVADPAQARAVGAESVRARLWQDPFAAVARHRRGREDEPRALSRELFEGRGERLAVLGVMVFSGPYDEQAERRLRSRHAVLSALGVLGYEPEDSEHLDYFEARLGAAPELVVPYEWLAKRAGAGGSLLLLWLNEEAFRSEPLARLAALFRGLRQSARPAELELKLLGPYGSTNLRVMAEELARCRRAPGSCPEARRGLADVQIYSPSATLAEDLLPPVAEGSLDGAFRRWTGSEKGRLLRTIGTDRKLGKVLVEELQRRGVDPACGALLSTAGDCSGDAQPAHVALVSEWDTHYGRALPCAFIGSALAGRYPGSCRESSRVLDAEPRWIHRFSYLRGLDGQLPAPPGAEKDEEKRAVRSATTESETVERPVGRRRLDYLRRLAGQLQRLDAALRREDRQGGLKAIGVLGSDVYDKLLVLQALRERFPHVVFFTTDLDAGLLHPAEYRSARNLVVVSNFGLELEARLQGNVPAFRDNYQTSLFFSTRLALAPGLREAPSQDDVDAWMKPRVFEIARSGAFDLSVETNEAGKAVPGGVWRWQDGESIHPPRVDLQARSLPPWLKEQLRWVVALAVVFFFLYRHTYRAVRPAADGLAARLSRARVLFALILLLGTLGLGALVSLQTLEDEPFALFEGISVWPSLFLRYFVGVLSLYFVVASWIRMKDSDTRLFRRYLPQLLGEPRKRRWQNWRGRARLARLSLGRRFRPRPELSFWHVGWPLGRRAGHQRKRSGHEAAEPPVVAAKLLRKHRSQSRLSRRLLRILPLWVLYFAVCFLVVQISGKPNVPHRGAHSLWATEVVTRGLAVIPLIFLIFWVADATKLSVDLAGRLADCKAKWPETTRRRFATELKMAPWLVGEWLDLRIIARHSFAVGQLVYCPVIAMILMIASRAPYFDNWDFPVGLCVVIAASLTYSIYCAVILRRSAEHARSAAIDHYGTALIRATGRGDRRSADQIRLILDRIRSLREGAFVPFSQQPWVRAVALLFGGGGGLVLFEYFLWVN